MENVCQIEGVNGGENYPYTYFTRVRFMPGNLRGTFPGYLVDGFDFYPDEWAKEGDLDKYIIPEISNLYREVWSDLAYSFQLANSAFLRGIQLEN